MLGVGSVGYGSYSPSGHTPEELYRADAATRVGHHDLVRSSTTGCRCYFTLLANSDKYKSCFIYSIIKHSYSIEKYKKSERLTMGGLTSKLSSQLPTGEK